MKKLLWILISALFLTTGCSKSEISDIKSESTPKAVLTETYVVTTITPTAMPTENVTTPTELATPTEAPVATLTEAPSKKASEVPKEKSTQAPAPAPTPSPIKEEVEKKENYITLSITGIEEKLNILPATEIEFNEGDTVFSVLLAQTKLNEIHMDFSGTKKNAYVLGIDNLYEYDHGEGSGWLYSVNGVFLNKSSGDYKLSVGDSVEWKYTKDMGLDLGAGDF